MGKATYHPGVMGEVTSHPGIIVEATSHPGVMGVAPQCIMGVATTLSQRIMGVLPTQE